MNSWKGEFLMTNTKKKSKNKMKLLSAIGMLTVSAAMLVSSTFAWFSMNKDVTATSMSVTAKSDSTFLLIKAGTATPAEIQTAKLIEDNAVTASKVLYPTAHDDITDTTGYTAIEANDTTDATVKDLWYYRYNRDPANATNDMTAVTYDPASTWTDDYVLLNEFSLTVADGSNALSNLQVKSCTITAAGDQAVKVLVAGANGCEEFSGAGGNGAGNVLQTANVTSSATSTVKIYVYWDGNDSDVYTNGVADLQNTSVEVVFTGDVVPAT